MDERESGIRPDTDSERPLRRHESRSLERKNIFVSAVLYSGGMFAPAKIRNLSERGALVEAGVLPVRGTRICLRRGNLEVAGVVVWHRDRKAGLQFDCTINVSDWLPSGLRRHQELVDKAIHEIRSGGTTADSPSSSASQPMTPHQIAELIKRVADELATDAAVVEKHGWNLQQLDVAAQQLANYYK